jgi:broad specificity phosphatase PhoE
MAQWLLVRHGETEWNSEGRMQGHSPTGLSETGVRQGQLLAERLKGTELDAIHCSDMPRARNTAEMIAAGRGLEVHTTSDLRERSYGQWEGMTRQEIREGYPEEYGQWRQGTEQFAPPDGESLIDVLARQARLTEELRGTYPGDQTIALIGHGGGFLTLAVSMLGVPMSLRSRFSLNNASISILQVSEDRAVLERWNDISHWEGKL